MRQFIVEKGREKNGLITLEGKDYRYFRQVLRVKAGDMINVRLPDGVLSNATVALVDEKQRRVTLQLCASTGSELAAEKSITRGVQASEIENSTSASGLSKVEYWLFQFLPRAQKFELIVRQATECGVAVIVPVIGEYTEKSSVQALQGAKRERLERIIKEARQQSGSPVETKVLEPVSLEQALDLWSGDLGFVLSERDDCSGNLRAVVASAENIKRAGIAVGSEGGISPEEVKYLQEKALFTPIHFAVNILRCETAALYGIAAVQCEINQSQVGK
ncbi:MAG: 16S rRNA (uracil(1498)-N(3))-methyltransferase [Treponema sp.]|nr:16S rRNA (uracil(1498)-N(3))-methyltransferase [Treponema sp.]